MWVIKLIKNEELVNMLDLLIQIVIYYKWLIIVVVIFVVFIIGIGSLGNKGDNYVHKE